MTTFFAFFGHLRPIKPIPFVIVLNLNDMYVVRLTGILLFALCISRAHAQKYSNEFLSIGIGAAASATGHAVVASVHDATAAYWNPAGLSAVDPDLKLQLAAMHTEWFAGVGKFDYLGALIPLNLKGKTIALSLLRFGVDNIPNTLTLYEQDGTVNYDNLSSFSAADYAFLLSYSQSLEAKVPGLRIGGNIKVIHRLIGPFARSWGFGLDAGLQYQRNRWQWGLVVRDITHTFNAWSFQFTEAEKAVLQLTNNEIPINSLELTRPSIVLGLSRSFDWGKYGLRPEINWIIHTDGARNTLFQADPLSFDPVLGLEGHYKEQIYLRVGVNQLQQETFFGEAGWTIRPSVGIGIHPGLIGLDYAFTDPGGTGESTYSHIVSLTLSLP